MKLIECLSDMVEEEIADAKKYVKKALELKDEKRGLADALYNLSNEEMRHMGILHGEVVKLIEDYRKVSGDPPVEMLAVYDYLHKKQIEAAGEVKSLQSLYKE